MSPKMPQVRLRGDTVACEEKSSGSPDGELLWLVPTEGLATPSHWNQVSVLLQYDQEFNSWLHGSDT